MKPNPLRERPDADKIRVALPSLSGEQAWMLFDFLQDLSQAIFEAHEDFLLDHYDLLCSNSSPGDYPQNPPQTPPYDNPDDWDFQPQDDQP
jgi:hypothetical protein